MTLTTLIRRSQGATAALVLLSVLQFTLSEPASSQVVEEIRANPELWTLRSIWKVTGTYSGEGVGAGIGSVGDLNKDGLGDFAYYTIDPPVVGGIWRVHYGSEGGPSKDTAWVFGQGAGGVSHPVVGKFRGDDSHDVGFLSYRWVDSGKTTDFYFQLRFFAVENDSLRSVPSYTWDPGLTMDSNWFTFPNDFLAMDMDQSEGDELVMVSSVSLRNRVRSQVGEIWLYKGGADFQVDQPTHVIVDQEENFLENQYYLYTEDFDGDSYIDMVLGTQYRDGNYKLKFWFGREGSPWNWTNEPDRVLLLGSTGLNHELSMGDYDGDGTVDLAGTVYDGDLRYIHIYLSSSGKDFRTRSFARSDAEKVLQTTLLRPFGRVGALNDSSGRYEMLSMIGPSIYHANEPMLVLFGGGKSGRIIRGMRITLRVQMG
ncbi:MAG: VCBS repeat-containing protein [Candidatus Kapaibacterium sp.]